MSGFVEGITSLITGIFNALISALGSIGNLVFTTGTEGAITGPSGFGWLLIIGLGVPLAWSLFNKLFTFLKGLGKGNR